MRRVKKKILIDFWFINFFKISFKQNTMHLPNSVKYLLTEEQTWKQLLANYGS